jgi:polar amino acid transport system substrate-binding protein
MHRSLLPLLCVAALAAADTVTLRADAYLPFNGDPKAERPGSIIEIAKRVFEKAGYSVDYQIMPWTRVIEEVKAGKLDGAVAAEPAGCPDLVMPAEAQGYWLPVFVTPAGSTWAYAGQASLAGQAIGVVQDYDYGVDPDGKSYNEWFKANPAKVQVLKGDKPNDLAIGMLAKKRLDLFIEDWGVVTAAAASAKVDPALLRKAGPSGTGYDLFIGFSPTDRGRKLAATLAAGTAELRASGELAKILAAYGMSDWKR